MKTIVIVLALAGSLACGPSPGAKGPNTGKTSGTSSSPSDSSQSGGADLTKPCLKPKCWLHTSGEYTECLHWDDGKCFHYGRVCDPGGQCRYDASFGGYKTCNKLVDGMCVSFGAPCKPKSKCLLDMSRASHRQCKSFANGKCNQFGAVCTPGS